MHCNSLDSVVSMTAPHTRFCNPLCKDKQQRVEHENAEQNTLKLHKEAWYGSGYIESGFTIVYSSLHSGPHVQQPKQKWGWAGRTALLTCNVSASACAPSSGLGPSGANSQEGPSQDTREEQTCMGENEKVCLQMPTKFSQIWLAKANSNLSATIHACMQARTQQPNPTHGSCAPCAPCKLPARRHGAAGSPLAP